jgi:MATE family multidrug resistance protein
LSSCPRRLASCSGTCLYGGLLYSSCQDKGDPKLITQGHFSVGVLHCSLENWYYRILVFLTGYVKNAELSVDALSIW